MDRLRGKLIVSCQASAGDPLDDVQVLCRLAKSVLLGGAGGLRAEGAACIAGFRKLTPLPIIGLVKRLDSVGEVYITPDLDSARAVRDAGADIVALDCTERRLREPEPWPTLLGRVRGELGRPVCADIATLADGTAAEAAGADFVATTLRGYTSETRGVREVDWPFLELLVRTVRIPVILEGHVTEPAEVRRAFAMGVHAVVVGSAITRPQTITERFVAAAQACEEDRET